jgi:hypothetical protein
MQIHTSQAPTQSMQSLSDLPSETFPSQTAHRRNIHEEKSWLPEKELTLAQGWCGAYQSVVQLYMSLEVAGSNRLNLNNPEFWSAYENHYRRWRLRWGDLG